MGLVLSVSGRRLRSPLVVRRRLASLLLVLYVAVAYGLPALHQVFHKNDHVHEGGGLRWLRRLPHVHADGATHEALEIVDDSDAPGPGSGARLRTARGEAAQSAMPHLAGGPLHGQQVLLPPLQLVSVAPAALCAASPGSLAAPQARAATRQTRARAPPFSV